MTVDQAPDRSAMRALAGYGKVIAMEGVWGAGKTTTATALADRLASHGFTAAVLHYGPREGVIGALDELLDRHPLRSRSGSGGYARPHHATIDVLLRLARDAHHHTRHYLATAQAHDVVLIDHGVYAKFAYALTVLAEADPPDADRNALRAQRLELLRRIVAPWFLQPDRAYFLDVPWPLARERAIGRGHGGGDPTSRERLLFLPGYEHAYRWVCDALPDQARTVPVGLRGAEEVVADIESDILALLGVPEGLHP